QPSGSWPSCETPRDMPIMIRSPCSAPPTLRSSRVESRSPTRRHSKVRPAACQSASASSSTRETSDGVTSTAVLTVTIIGGGADVGASAAPGETASAAAARLVMISILPAIDGRNHQKFDVRKRQERTPLNLEIDRDDVVRQRHAELRNRDMPVV